MPKKYKVILIDSSVNRYGYRIAPSGVHLSNYAKNPVLLVDHLRGAQNVIGSCRAYLENGILYGELEFDPNDAFALQIESKFDNGYLNAVSVWIEPTKVLEAIGGELMKVLESELLEVSIVDIPGNANSVKLQYKGAIGQNAINYKLNLNYMNYTEIAFRLGLAATATEQEILAAIGALQDSRIVSLLSMGRLRGTVTDTNEASLRTLARLSYSDVETIVMQSQPAAANSQPAPQPQLSVNSLLNHTNDDNRTAWTIVDWQKRDSKGLLAMKKTNESAYNQLIDNYLKQE